MKTFIILLFLISCSSTSYDDNYQYPSIDNRVIPFIRVFEKKFNASIKDSTLKIKFVESKIDFVGRCFLELKLIQINNRLWKDLDLFEREHIVFHELGHCYFQLGHSDEADYEIVFNSKCPKSIMYWLALPLDCYKNNRNYYIDEFKERIKNRD